jgi:hypothetical protein
MKRLDNLCRSERYFTSTLLAGLLLYDDLEGLYKFLQWLINEKNLMLNLLNGSDKIPLTLPLEKPDHIEVITEFNVKRELKHYSENISSNPEEWKGQNVPDVIIVYGDVLIVIEAKFFVKGQTPEYIDNQLLRQKEEIRLMLDYIKPQIQYWHHMYLGPNKISLNNCDFQLTWEEIEVFSNELLGSDAYISTRLKFANSNYLSRYKPSDSSKMYSGKCSYGDILELCKKEGDKIVVGFTGGYTELINREYSYLVARDYKWDHYDSLQGKISANWLKGTLFLNAVSNLARQNSKTGSSYARKVSSKGRNYIDKADFDEIKLMCKKHGFDILIGFSGGKDKLKETSLKELMTRKFKYDFKNNLQGKKTSNNWINGTAFLNFINQKAIQYS